MGVGELDGVDKRKPLFADVAEQTVRGEVLAVDGDRHDAFVFGDGRADGIVGEDRHDGRIADDFAGLDFGADDRGDGRRDGDGHRELLVQLRADVDVAPPQVGRVDNAVGADGAGCGHADGRERTVEVRHEAVESGHDVLDEVVLAEMRDGQFDVDVADGASFDVEERDVRGGRAHGDSGEDGL